MLNHLHVHYGTATDGALLDHLQDEHAISDLCLTVAEIAQTDLTRAYNATFTDA